MQQDHKRLNQLALHYAGQYLDRPLESPVDASRIARAKEYGLARAKAQLELEATFGGDGG